MTSLRFIFIAAIVAILQGCASLPSPDQMRSETRDFKLPRYPEAGQAIVYVVRPAAVGGLVRFNVFLDDKEADSEMGFTRGSQYIYFSVAPGERKIQSKAENWAEWTVNAKPGDIIFIRQNAEMGFVIARNTIFKIDDDEGKYHVKNLEIGTLLKYKK